MGSHETMLRTFVLSMVPCWSEADDILQEVRIRLWDQVDQYDPTKEFGAWARTIAYYQVLTYREKQTRERTLFVPEFFESVHDQFDSVTPELDGRRDALAKCLQKLDEAKRAVLLRYYSGNETMKQVAQSLGRSIDSIRHSVLRSRKQLATCVEETLRRESTR